MIYCFCVEFELLIFIIRHALLLRFGCCWPLAPLKTLLLHSPSMALKLKKALQLLFLMLLMVLLLLACWLVALNSRLFSCWRRNNNHVST